MRPRLRVIQGFASLRGMGDAVALVAEPVARVVHLDKSKCNCNERQAEWNKMIPFKRNIDSDAQIV